MKLLKEKMLIMKILTFLHTQLFVYFSQKSHSQAFDTEIVQCKDVNNGNLEFVKWSAVCLFFSKKATKTRTLSILKLLKISH